MKTKLILVRHGETESNLKGTLDGQEDILLTKQGHLQVKKLAEILSSEKIDVIYTSPLTRTQIIAKLVQKSLPNAPIHTVNEFIEIDCGKCTLMTIPEIKKEYPELIQEWKKQTDPKFPNGESLKDVMKRSTPKLKEIIDQNQGKTILISGHGALNRGIIAYFLSIPSGVAWNVDQDNCCINEFIIQEGKVVVKKINQSL